jgi:hypothetical protein
MMPFRILDVERQVQANVETVGEEISQTAYFSMFSEEKEEGMELVTSLTAYGYAEARVRAKLENLPVERISLLSSRLLTDGETVDLVVNYELRLPFSIFGLGSVKRTSRSYHRAWIGKEGIGTGAEGTADDEDEIVYIGKNSTRYHKTRTCHYLDNRLQTVALSKIENYRNKSGSRYNPCSRCGRLAETVVYIMESGEHYHSTSSCTAILAYVSAVPKSQVEYLGPCSYCYKVTGR